MTHRPPHLLYVAMNFPPSRSSGVYRAVATANAFARAGWDVTVLTVADDAWEPVTGTDRPLLARVDPSIRVVRTPFRWPHLEGDVRRWSRLRVEAPYVWRSLYLRANRRHFPEGDVGHWFRPARSAAMAVHEARPVDLTIATASPSVSFGVAAALYEKGVPYVMDYRDGWQLHTVTGARTEPPGARVHRLEAAFISDATEVWFTNEKILDWHANLYPDARDRMRVVANGWDPDPGRRRHPVRPTGRVRFGYLGTLNREAPLGVLVDGWDRAFGGTDGVDGIVRGHLGSTGSPDDVLLDQLSRAERAGLRYGGPISRTQAWDFYTGTDALLLLLGAGRYATAGKMAEYLSTGLPIVSVHEPGNGVESVLKDYPLWFRPAELTAEGIADALRSAAQEVRQPHPAAWEAAWQFGETFDRDAQLAPRVRALTEEVGRAR